MESQLRQGLGAGVRTLGRRAAAWVANARFEALLLALLLATLAAITLQDRILQQTVRLTPDNIGGYARLGHTDSANAGHSTLREHGPLRWSCELRTGFDYPYCAYELFFDRNAAMGPSGINLTNLRSMSVTMLYRGPGKSFRVHLKNFDPRYSKEARDDTPKFNRVESPTDRGRLQTTVFEFADFGVADWWLTKHELPPKLSHPQFDNVTSIDIQTGTDCALGVHEFEIREIVLTRALLSDAQWYLSLLGAWVVMIGVYLAWRLRNMKGELERRRALQAMAMRHAEEAEEEARQDHLTAVLNRRGIAERFPAISDESAGTPGLAAILIDIDWFKALNDHYGHSYGDEVLSAIATLIKRNVRPGDAVGRWGHQA